MEHLELVDVVVRGEGGVMREHRHGEHQHVVRQDVWQLRHSALHCAHATYIAIIIVIVIDYSHTDLSVLPFDKRHV